MIQGKDLAWHYDACIEMWNEIAEGMDANESDYDISVKKKTTLCKMYYTHSNCFACEAFNCDDCPFAVYGNCGEIGSPYKNFEDHKGTQQDAIAIAQLFIDYYPE
jgi:hypothetical protein